MIMRFKDKVVLVTGSNQNTGLEIASLFIKEGARVIVHGSSNETVQKGVEKLKSIGIENFKTVSADISDVEQVRRMFLMIKEEFGRLDILVNNACHQGIGEPFEDMDYSFFQQVINVNLLGTFMVSQQAVKLMTAQESKGVIVNLGSNVSTRAIHNRTAYIASKGGIDALTRSMATDLGPLGIRVNMVAPGYIYTNRWDLLSEEVKSRRRQNVPLGKEATGEDIAEAVAFLASDRASAIGGARLVVDGGISAQHLPVDIDF
jgi:NAD(P)-dependent dehydrogenase (short-subunit alcohol dehydrogenase family)